MLNILLILIGKFISKISNMLNLGSGSTWPGHIALTLNKSFIREILKNSKIKVIVIAGTNGKTTTGKMIQTILEKNGERVFQNQSGANLLNGIASSIIFNSGFSGKINYDYAIFEVDENTLPSAITELNPDYIILLNLFRDQLDRYGEVNSIAKKWKKSLSAISSKTTLVLNADDPLIVFLGKDIKAKTKYFGIEPAGKSSLQTGFGIEPTNQVWKSETADSIYCPRCNSKLTYKTVYFSHLGDWTCLNCQFTRPKLDFSAADIYPLVGTYNKYNTNAAVLFAKSINIDNKVINSALRNFAPAFGRQEIIEIDGKKVGIFLSKNPTSFNESLRTVIELGGKNLLLVLNDRIPDGRDVSWIWDTELNLERFENIYVSGDRAFDMGLRLKYENQSAKIKNQNYSPRGEAGSSKVKIIENLKEAIVTALKETPQNETLYILPTYSAMLEVRKILTGKKIL